MSDQGEKTCPLCAEEMDLTDQQLKPCKCGYEICVWCWHHIMDMAEKDDTEGRCPACRLPYDKEKIVGMTTNCERFVAEMNTGWKKSQKAKTKLSEGRKQLGSVRVIQRNLVYIVGLPLDLADEVLLQHKEYFGQYGKVLKVSMSRTAAGVIQQFPNNSCSVYITYSKEEEAIRCIQSVHGFILDGRSLKACFGTTKYCHAWLRNVPCTNPDCLYLHEIGSQEDSFTKDEIISAYTRSRVQQITGAMNNTVRRSGSRLPPPVDDYCSNYATSAPKPIVKSFSSNATNTNKISPPNGSSGRSIALPAAASWGMRASNQTQPASSTLLNEPSKSRPDTVSRTSAFSSAVTSTTQAETLHIDALNKSAWNEESRLLNGKVKQDFLKPLQQNNALESAVSLLEKHPANDCTHMSTRNVVNAADHTGNTLDPETVEKGPENELDKNSSMVPQGVDIRTSSTVSDHGMMTVPGSQGLKLPSVDQFKEPVTLPVSDSDVALANIMSVSGEQLDWRTDPLAQASVNIDVEDDIKSFDNQRLKDPEVVSRTSHLPNSTDSLHVSNHSRSHSLQLNGTVGTTNLNPDLFVDSRIGDRQLLCASSNSLASNGHLERPINKPVGFDRNLENSILHPAVELGNHGGLKFDANDNVSLDVGESSIISNILSLDLDGLDDSVTSPQNLARWFGDIDKQSSSLKMSNSWKAQGTNQSRFSFARQESSNEAFDINSSFNVFSQLPKNSSFGQEFAESRNVYLDRLGMGNGFSSSNFGDLEAFTGNPSVYSSHNPSVSRAQISAPPGFSVPNRVPPPGFSSHERMNQTFDAGNDLLNHSSLLRNSFRPSSTGNIGGVEDIEFIDPAILAVGKGRLQAGLNAPGLDMRSSFSQQFSAFDNEAGLQQLLMQGSLPPQQNLRYTGDSFSSLNDSFGISSRLVDQPPISNLSSFSQVSLQQPMNRLLLNGHWDTWNGVQGGNSLVIEDLLRSERLGHNNFYNSGHEEAKFRMPSSGDLYNRTFGM